MRVFIRGMFLALMVFALPILASAKSATAIFAGGNFWYMETDYHKVPGVLHTVSGYIGGTVKDPTYSQVVAGDTGHYEALQITYNPEKVSYKQLLDVFWHITDPTDADGQFCDKGPQYRAAIFYLDKHQKKLAEESKKALMKTHRFKKIVTPILPATTFYPAENYHQDFNNKHPLRYQFYQYKCGRDQRLQEVWHK